MKLVQQVSTVFIERVVYYNLKFKKATQNPIKKNVYFSDLQHID